MKKIKCRKFVSVASLQPVTPGGGYLNYRNDSLNTNNTFFRRGIRAG